MTKKIVIATDVRFWRRQTGAEQRIFALAMFLQESGFSVTVCFTSAVNEQRSQLDSQLIVATGLEVTSLIDDWRPDGILQNVFWQAKCIVNAAFPSAKPSTASPYSRNFADFESKEIAQRFHQFLAQARPNIVIVEYVTLSYLVPHANKKNGVLFAVDTHDLLSKRSQLFEEQGFIHWVDISPEQEAIALEVFDLIVAIQSEEAVEFSKLIRDSVPVVVAGHPMQVRSNRVRPRTEPSIAKLTLGYLASNNSINRLAIQWFLENVWSEMANRADIELIVAGSVCDVIEDSHENVQLMGRVKSLEDHYAAVDVAINPVPFGTGLKIKTVEAIAFGLPLITTPHGAAGLADTKIELPCLIAEKSKDWLDSIQKLLAEPDTRTRLATQARLFAESNLRPENVFSRLLDYFNEKK